MSTGRAVGVGALAVAGIALCCALPLLLSVAAGITIAGLGLRSWLLVTLGVGIGVLTMLLLRRRGTCAVDPSCDLDDDTDAEPGRTR